MLRGIERVTGSCCGEFVLTGGAFRGEAAGFRNGLARGRLTVVLLVLLVLLMVMGDRGTRVERE